MVSLYTFHAKLKRIYKLHSSNPTGHVQWHVAFFIARCRRASMEGRCDTLFAKSYSIGFLCALLNFVAIDFSLVLNIKCKKNKADEQDKVCIIVTTIKGSNLRDI